MPAHMTKLPSGKYQVSTPNQVHTKATTKKKAESQARLLNAIDHGFKPTKQQDRSTKSSPPADEADFNRGYKELGSARS